ncbi:hypothetical protein ACFLZU_06815, partial [Thermodesulfobacteriota bacterium]
MTSSLVGERTESEARSRAIASASGAGGRKFKFCHPDQCLHESDLPGVALSFCSPVHVWSEPH